MQFSPKSEDQLAWDLIKVAVRAKVGVEVAQYRNRRVNEMLGDLWPAFQAALNGEEFATIDPMYENWVLDALNGAGYPGAIS